MAEGHKNFSGEELPDVAPTKAAFDTDVTQKLPSEDDDREGEITVSVEGYAEAVPLGTGAAAAANFPQGEFDDKFLTCDICQNIFDDPRILPCHHTFCARCLGKWCKGKSEFTCPTCRQEVTLKEAGISSLPSNFHINKLIDFRTQQSREEVYPQCQMCESGAKVAGSCRNCHFFLCKNCITAHGKTPALKDHNITQIDIPTENCPQHTDQPLTFYCLPCTKLVCQECTTTEHPKGPNHDPQEVSKVTEVFKEELQTLVGETQNKLKETDYILRKELISIRTNCELEKQKIQEHFAQLRANLDQEEQQMTSRLREMEGEQQKSLLEKRKDFEETLSPNEERLQFCKDILTRGSDVEILTLKEQLKYNLNHLKTQKISYGGLSQEITFADNRDIKAFRCSPGFLKHSNTNIKVTELPVESLPTTIIFDTSSLPSQGGKPPRYRSREATPQVTVFPESLYKYCQQKMRLPIDVSKERCAILDTTKISEELFEAVWRPQTSGKHVVGITTWDERRGIGWESFIRPSPLTQVTVNVGSNNPVLRFGRRGRQQGLFERPRDVAVRGDRLYVADAGNSRVQVFDLSGNFCFSIPTTASLASLAVQTDGTILVNCDEEVIQKFSPSGELMNKFSLAEHCISPYGLAVQRDGRVVVAEPGKHSIFLFEADGTLVKQVGGLGKGDGQLNRPCFVCVDKEDNIIVADTGNSRVQVFDKDLHFQYKFGVKGTQPQDMCYPMGVSVDSRGNIVLVNLGETIDETVQGVNLQVFRPDGTWVSTISSDGDKLKKTHGMAVTEDGHVFVTDIKDHCIRKYRYM
ncbi:tripartite motif-containing protein 2-like [Branchiostoma lanceolatum]|uniref:tripartite motif-containing protein 2-like n=1 Tax=Branchiostoma lanceolatum TaxID=7740 RepID=UPI0034563016